MTRTITKEKRIIGQRIKYFRELRGMSQIELNRLAGYKGRGMMGFIEEGSTGVSQDKLKQIAEILNVPVSVLVTPIEMPDAKIEILSNVIKILQMEGKTPNLDAIAVLAKQDANGLV
jgi:transcriptional regulator with XRE-family HTH domain